MATIVSGSMMLMVIKIIIDIQQHSVRDIGIWFVKWFPTLNCNDLHLRPEPHFLIYIYIHIQLRLVHLGVIRLTHDITVSRG